MFLWFYFSRCPAVLQMLTDYSKNVMSDFFIRVVLQKLFVAEVVTVTNSKLKVVSLLISTIRMCSVLFPKIISGVCNNKLHILEQCFCKVLLF